MDTLPTITIRRGSKLDLEIELNDAQAVSARFIVRETATSGVDIISQEVAVTNGVATFNISSSETDIEVADYVYQINVYDSAGDYDVYPDSSDCDDDCDLPVFTVCEAFTDGVS